MRQESLKFSRQSSGYGRDNEDVPPPIPPPPPPALLDPPPLQYQPPVYITDSRKVSKSFPAVPTTLSSTRPQVKGSGRPAVTSTRGAFSLQQFLQAHHARHRTDTYNQRQRNKQDTAIYKRVSKSRCEANSENSVNRYNNSNNANISVAQSKSSSYQYSNGSKFLPPGDCLGRQFDSARSIPKVDIRMGTRSMMSIYGEKLNDSKTVSGQKGPPKPPRSLESHSLDKNLNGKLDSKASNSCRKHYNDSTSLRKLDAFSPCINSNNHNNEKIYNHISRPAAAIAGRSVNNSSVTGGTGLGYSGQPATGSSCSSSPPSWPYHGRAPASLPLTGGLSGGYSLHRSQTHSLITTTQSLERDSRPDSRTRLLADTNLVPRPR